MKNYQIKNVLLTALFVVLSGGSRVFAAFPISYPGCEDVTADDFQVTHLVSHPARPEAASAGTLHPGLVSLVRFDLLKNGDDYDIFFGGFSGILYRYNALTKQVTVIHDFKTVVGSVPNPHNGGDHGVTGIAFHPNFEANRWVFIFYTPMVADDQNRVMLLSRWEMTPDYQLQNEKVLLRMEATTTDKWHSGGDMYFTAHGDLWLQVGDNVANDRSNTSKTNNAAWTSANTTNLIGGIVRIHPDSSERGYSIPKGNFGEYFAPLENNPDYLDTNHVKAEIYAKGQRSNFYSTGHPTEHIHIWGEICTASNTDEVNIINKPMYGGWPHIQGDREQNYWGGTSKRYPFTFDDVPTLSEVVAGNLVEPEAIQTLPMAQEADLVAQRNFNNIVVHALYFYGKSGIIRPGRTFPPHFHETFMVGSFLPGNTDLTFPNHRIVPLIKDGPDGPTASFMDETYRISPLFNSDGIFKGMVEAKYGPDGALYTMSRNAQYGRPPGMISRVDYIGSCQDQALADRNRQEFLEVSKLAADPSRYRDGFYEPDLYVSTFERERPVFLKAGEQLHMKIFDVRGKKLGTFPIVVNASNRVPQWDGMLTTGQMVSEGVYFLMYLDAKGNLLFSRKRVFQD